MYNHDKNEKLKKERGISFEDAAQHIAHGKPIAIGKHKNQKNEESVSSFHAEKTAARFEHNQDTENIIISDAE